MLEFFRKNQKVLFIVIAGFVIISFLFFGTQGTLRQENRQHAADQMLGKMVNGARLHSTQLDLMKRFLETDRWDYELQEKGERVNFFNNGVIRRDLLETGLAQILVNSYFDAVYADLEKRFEKEKTYAPYRHPRIAQLSVETMWSQFVPSLVESLKKMQEFEEVNPELFALKTHLYLDQGQFPPHMLRRFLLYQQSQSPHTKPDNSLQTRDLGIFSHKSLEDWFGKQFINLSAQFILNAAVIAKEKGYSVSKQEAKADLLRSGYEAMSENGQREVSSEMLTKMWHEQLAVLGFSEKQVVDVWRKVLLFRRLFDDKGSSVLLDRMLYEKYHAYSSETLVLDTYEVADFMKVKNLKELFGLLYYQRTSHPMNYRQYDVEVVHVSEDDLMMNVGVKEMWEWQASEAGLKKLSSRFKTLKGGLDTLSENERSDVDQYSRKEIVKDNEHWITEMLEAAARENQVLKVSLDGSGVLEGISNHREFVELLEKQDTIEKYTQDGKHYYRITVLERGGEKPLDYVEAKQLGVLDRVLEKELKKKYKEMKSSLTQEGSAEKSFEESELEVGKAYFKKELLAIEKAFCSRGGKLKKGSLKEEEAFYTTNAHYEKVLGVLDRLKKGENFESEGQFALVRRHVEVMRKQASPWNDEILFAKDADYISDVKIFDEQGHLGFCQVKERRLGDGGQVAQHMKEGQEMLGLEAKRMFMQSIVERIKSEEGIHLEAQRS